MDTKKVGKVNFGTDFRIVTGHKLPARDLAINIAGEIVNKMPPRYNAQLAKIVDENGNVIVKTSVGNDKYAHIGELTALKEIVTGLKLDGVNKNFALDHINACLSSARATQEYHKNVKLSFPKS